MELKVEVYPLTTVHWLPIDSKQHNCATGQLFYDNWDVVVRFVQPG